MRIVGGHEGQIQLPSELNQLGTHLLFDPQAVVHHLDEIVLRAKQLGHLPRHTLRLVILAKPKPGLHFPAGAAGRGDNAVVIGLEKLTVHPRFEVIPLQRRQRRQPEEIVHTLCVFCPQREVGIGTCSGDVIS